MFILSTTINIMPFNHKLYNEILEIKSSNEDLAFEKLQELLVDYMKDYTCDNVFYLYHIDQTNNYQCFREDTKLVFELLYSMFYDEEQFNEVSNDPKIQPEIVKYRKFIESLKFIREHIATIPLNKNNDNEDSVEVKCFNKYMNYCKSYLEEVYNGMKDLNNIMDDLNNNLEELTNKLTNLVGQTA